MLALRQFTDPGSALAFAAEPQRLRLLWRYGDQLEWELRLAVRSTERDQNGLDAGRQASWLRRVRRDSGMPIETRQRRYAAPTVHACRAVVAVRERWPEHADAYLRHLRVLIMGGEMADDSDTFEIAAERCGLPVENHVRGLLKNLGLVIGRAKFNVFAVRAEELIEGRPELIAAIRPLLEARNAVGQQVSELDRKVMKLARHDAQVRQFMTVPGVGPIAALAFKATIDDPARFARSKST